MIGGNSRVLLLSVCFSTGKCLDICLCVEYIYLRVCFQYVLVFCVLNECFGSVTVSVSRFKDFPQQDFSRQNIKEMK